MFYLVHSRKMLTFAPENKNKQPLTPAATGNSGARDMATQVTYQEFANDLFNFIATAIQDGISGSAIADGLCSIGIKREHAIEAIMATGAKLNMKAGAESFQEGLAFFCGK